MSNSQAKSLSYGCVLYPGFQLLDASGPLDLLSFMPGTKFTMLAETLTPISTKNPASQSHHPAFGVSVQADSDYATFLASNETLDVLIIPGGIGSRDPVNACDATRDFIRKIAPRITTAIITVCTGSDVLASTGLLDNQGVRACTNVTRYELVSTKHGNRGIEWLNKVRWVKSAIKAPHHLEIWSSAGVSAGMDVMLAFIAEKYSRDAALMCTRSLEYQWRELAESEHDDMYDDFP